ncbi:MAG TPA: SDR family oxidoreductase [Candidatus Limnocylindrales bacterium]|nr:SDR family oxidoreductase [Candidatus Limnocylindrales bacterium]
METRHAVVTGAASGIGQATAALLLARGHAVLATDVRPDGLESLAAQGARTLVADLSTPEGRASVVAAAGEMLAAAGAALDWLVNAAGMIVLRPIGEVDTDDLRRVFAVNVESTFMLCQQLGVRMRDGGAIVNFSSPSAKFVATTEAAAYAITKAAVSQVTRSFAMAYAPRGIRVNALSPGITDTPMQERVLNEVAAARGISRDELEAARLKTVPMGRSSQPSEIAAIVAWLLSDEASYITGQVINADGGMVMW